MPVYQFRCPECSSSFEEKRSFARCDDPALCPSCGSQHLDKVFAPAMFYSPGMAAKSLLEPKPPRQTALAKHGVGCPCCGGA